MTMEPGIGPSAMLANAPPDAEGPAPERTGHSSIPDTHRDCEPDGTPWPSRLAGEPGELFRRCTDGQPCPEVSARLVAADRAKYELGLDEAARQLRETASRWAQLHSYGMEVYDEVEL